MSGPVNGRAASGPNANLDSSEMAQRSSDSYAAVALSTSHAGAVMNAGATKSLEQKHDNANISLALGDPKLSQTACDADLSGSDINDHEVVGMVTVDVEANQRKNRRSLRRRGTAALHSWASRLRLKGIWREMFAEFLGTMVLLMFGDGVVAQTVLSRGTAGSSVEIHLCWGLAVLFGILVSGGVSGAHLNPAVSFTLAIFGRLPWKKFVPYVCAQMLGAFVGAAMVYSVYAELFSAYDNGELLVTGPNATAGVFATYPQANVKIINAIWTETVGTALLLGGIFAIADKSNVGLPGAAGPFTVAALVVAIGMAFGYPTGYAINPARDFGPRFFTFIAGWGSEVFTVYDNYFLVPLLAPMMGGPIGAFVYYIFIERHHPSPEQ